MTHKEQIEWLVKNTTAPKIEMLEPTIQAFSLLFSLNDVDIDESYLVTLALAGYFITHTRYVNEEIFTQITPEAYLEMSLYHVETTYKNSEFTEESLKKLLETVKSLINNSQR